jgi:POT family proton-dependent oligopeptide transporter
MRRLLEQPKGLFPLFFTELWERFGFYTVSTILVLYLSKGLGYSDKSAYLLYGAFSSMLYLMPVLGGYIADKYLGFRRSIVLGGILFMIGYTLMSIPNERALFLGLSIVILGNGFFKPNVSGIVGDLYEPEDPRRDGGFTLFYMGINIGALIPPIFAGALVAAYTWGAGFLAAALGMIFSLITFLWGRKYFGEAGAAPHEKHRFSLYALIFVGMIGLIFLLQIILRHPAEADLFLFFVSLAVIGVVLYFLSKEDPIHRRRMIACLVLILLSVGFWAVYNQTYTSLMLFADRNMSKEFLGLTIDAEFTQFFNPFFIIAISPFLSRFWVHLDRRNSHPSTPLKFSLGILFVAIGFFVLSMGIQSFNQGGLASPWWLVFSYLIQTLGELFISPIGLAMVTRLSPKHLVGMMMGVWFLTQSAAFAIGGGLATLCDVPEEVGKEASLRIYSHAFEIYGGIALALSVISFMLVPTLKKLIEKR